MTQPIVAFHNFVNAPKMSKPMFHLFIFAVIYNIVSYSDYIMLNGWMKSELCELGKMWKETVMA
jgi:hypothetical protein